MVRKVSIENCSQESHHFSGERFNKDLHLTLKNGTSDSRKEWFVVGDYKKVPNEVGGMNTALPEEVPSRMKELLKEYNGKKECEYPSDNP